MAINGYEELSEHYGHSLEVVMYGEGVNVALECNDCNEVLLDYDKEEEDERHSL